MHWDLNSRIMPAWTEEWWQGVWFSVFGVRKPTLHFPSCSRVLHITWCRMWPTNRLWTTTSSCGCCSQKSAVATALRRETHQGIVGFPVKARCFECQRYATTISSTGAAFETSLDPRVDGSSILLLEGKALKCLWMLQAQTCQREINQISYVLLAGVSFTGYISTSGSFLLVDPPLPQLYPAVLKVCLCEISFSSKMMYHTTSQSLRLLPFRVGNAFCSLVYVWFLDCTRCDFADGFGEENKWRNTHLDQTLLYVYLRTHEDMLFFFGSGLP